MRFLLSLTLALLAAPAFAQSACSTGAVYRDDNGNGRRDSGEPGLPGIKVSDGERIAVTGRDGGYALPPRISRIDDGATERVRLEDVRTVFVVKPAGFRFPAREDGTPDFWRHLSSQAGPHLRYGGIAAQTGECRDFALIPDPKRRDGALEVLVFSDPQPKSLVDVGYYERDIVGSVLASRPPHVADLGISLGDIVHDDLSLYPALNRATARMHAPWLHVAGNHDLDLDAARDEDSLLTFRNTYGPDTFAWEEDNAVFVALDDVVYRPPPAGSYIGGLREAQFAFLSAYLATVPRDRLLVIGMHIPLFDAAPGKETFRHADRERLFALLQTFPRLLVLSGHSHTQRHVFHDASTGWHGATPLHEYNVGAACGSFWSGVKDAEGIPDTTMADGTPNGFATLHIAADRSYRLAWHPARDVDTAIALHAPEVVRRGSWPGTFVYANVFMGHAGTRVEARIDDGEWKPMQRTEQPDPRVVAENMRDDAASELRAYDRLPEASPSQHLWRAVLPTDLPPGEHRITVRAIGVTPGRDADTAQRSYRLLEASP